MPLDYDSFASDYLTYRVPDARIAAQIGKELSTANRVINVGAGLGSYEPTHCEVVALEPSAKMIKGRPATASMAIQGVAESIPYPDNHFDCSMAILTIHHWTDLAKGLSELKRVSRHKVVLMTWIDDSPRFWLEDYFPEIRDIDRAIFPVMEELTANFSEVRIETIPIPADCTDGFMCAYWKRPEAYLESGVRGAISTFARLDDVSSRLTKLEADIQSGQWHETNKSLLGKDSLDLGYRLIVLN